MQNEIAKVVTDHKGREYAHLKWYRFFQGRKIPVVREVTEDLEKQIEEVKSKKGYVRYEGRV